jgi:hypothetical protein
MRAGEFSLCLRPSYRVDQWRCARGRLSNGCSGANYVDGKFLVSDLHRGSELGNSRISLTGSDQ